MFHNPRTQLPPLHVLLASLPKLYHVGKIVFSVCIFFTKTLEPHTFFFVRTPADFNTWWRHSCFCFCCFSKFLTSHESLQSCKLHRAVWWPFPWPIKFLGILFILKSLGFSFLPGNLFLLKSLCLSFLPGNLFIKSLCLSGFLGNLFLLEFLCLSFLPGNLFLLCLSFLPGNLFIKFFCFSVFPGNLFLLKFLCFSILPSNLLRS